MEEIDLQDMRTRPDSRHFTVLSFGKNGEGWFSDKELHVESVGRNRKKSVLRIPVNDIVGVLETDEGKDGRAADITAYYIERNEKKYTWVTKAVTLTGVKTSCEQFARKIRQSLLQIEERPRKLLVVVNPFGGSKSGRYKYVRFVAPLFDLARIQTEVIETECTGHAKMFLQSYDLEKVDGVICVGGDGTFNEIIDGMFLNIQEKSGKNVNNPEEKWTPVETPVGVIPGGTWNGIVRKCCNCMDVITAALHIIVGNVKKVHTYTVHENGRFLNHGGILIAYGFFADLIAKTDNCRFLGIIRFPLTMLASLFDMRKFDAVIDYLPCEKPITLDSSGDGSSSESGNTAGWTAVSGRFISASAICFQLKAEDKAAFARGEENNILNLNLVLDTGKLNLVKHIIRSMRQAENSQDFDFVRQVRTTGFRVTVKAEEGSHAWTARELSLNCDGEVRQCTQPRFEVRFHVGVIRAFSSL